MLSHGQALSQFLRGGMDSGDVETPAPVQILVEGKGRFVRHDREW